MIGSTLSHFKVTAKLGEGGMGEVYRAEDTKLGRDVAIKVLPVDLAADPVRLERFAREAKAVAALDHPNIVTVHEIEQADGIHFIAMQLVEGKTLGQVIPTGGMAVEQIFATAIPLADALSAAHEAGVVHRDLKPGNIMVGSDGRVRILDFGLAKLQADPSQPGSTQMGTEMLTTEGQIIGTVAYMSPEQAEGKLTDARTDVFSLGVLLYQMATGRLPFRGETQISTITAIIRDAPTPIIQLRDELPWHLGRIVKRALDKDPERRYQSAKDLRNDLETLRAELASGELSAGGERAIAAAEAARGSLRRAAGWAVAAALLLAALAGGYLLGRSSAGGEGRAAPSTGLGLKQVSFSAGFESWPSLTPDGEWAVYGGREAGDLDIYLQSVGGYKPINLTEDSRFDDYEPALSPDGQRIAFRSERQGGGIFVMQRTGESVRRVASIGYSPAWSPDGRSLVVATEHIPGMPYSRATVSQLWRLDPDSAEQSLLTAGDAVEPRWSPNGARIVFWGLQRSSGQRDLFTIPAAGGDPQPLTDDPATDWSPAWAPDGRSVYFASDRSGAMNIWRIPVDESSGEALGPPEQITSGGASWSVRPFFSQDGRRMAFSEGRWRYDVYRLPLEPRTGRAAGPTELVLGGSRNTLFPAISPDGQRLAFSTSVGQQEDLFVVRLDGTGLTQLTDDLAKDRGARWSPAGDRLAFYSDRSGTYEIWLVNADGSGLQPLSVSTSQPADRVLWSADGSQLAINVRDEPANRSTTLVLDLSPPVGEGNPRELPAATTGERIFNAQSWSADGDRILGAFVSTSGGLAEIAYYSFSAEEYWISSHQGEYPMWLADGRRAIFFAADKLYLLDTTRDRVEEIFSVAPGTVGDFPSVSTDDRWLYFTLQTPEFDIWIADLGRES